MAVQNQDTIFIYQANGVTGSFAYGCQVLESGDLKVFVNDVETAVGFTITGIGNPTGGSVDFSVDPVVNTIIRLERIVTLQRLTDYQQTGDFFSATVNKDFDRLWMAHQQAKAALDNSIKFPSESPLKDSVLPSAAARANRTLVFDVDGNVSVSADDYTDNATAAAASAAAAAASESAVNAAAAEVEIDRVSAEAAAVAAAASAASIDPSNLVHRTGAESIAGIKTFTDSPLVPAATTSGQAVNKGQLDAFVIPKHLSGLVISTAGSSTTISVSAGYAANSDDTVMMRLAAVISKTTAAWAVGTGNGGLDAGTISNNTGYHLFGIMRPDTAVVDVIFSVSATAPTLPASYTKFRRLGWAKTNGSGQWTSFIQIGDEFYWGTPVLEFYGAGSTAARLLAISVPSGVKVKAQFNLSSNGGVSGAGFIYLSSPDVSDLAPSAAAAPLSSMLFSGATSTSVGSMATCFTNTSAQIRHRELNTETYGIATLGWIDTRGRSD